MKCVLLSNSQILTKRNTVKMSGRFKETSLEQGVGRDGAEDWRAWETDWEKRTEQISNLLLPERMAVTRATQDKEEPEGSHVRRVSSALWANKGGATRAEGSAASERGVWPWCGNQ